MDLDERWFGVLVNSYFEKLIENSFLNEAVKVWSCGQTDEKWLGVWGDGEGNYRRR